MREYTRSAISWSSAVHSPPIPPEGAVRAQSSTNPKAKAVWKCSPPRIGWVSLGIHSFSPSAAARSPAGVAQSVVTLLESRGLEPDETAREKILGCKDIELLRRWLVRAATVTRIEDLFAA